MASTGDTWRLHRLPALDGLRGIAVLMVLANHFGAPGFKGGTVGVVVFFTLSGFLITSLLLDQLADSGRMDLRRFYARRVRRLGPALLACVSLVVVIQLALAGWVRDASLVLTTLTWTANFEMVDGVFPQPTGLGHTWSLAIEEQFYLVWPLVLIGVAAWSRRAVVWALLAACAGSLVLRLALWDGTSDGWFRVYFGTDTRADSLLYGCVLAFLVRRATWTGGRWMVVVGAAGIAVWCPTAWQGDQSWQQAVILPAAAAVATCLMIYPIAMGLRVRWLEGRTLTTVGLISYGLYLYHGPVLLLVQQQIGYDLEAALFFSAPLTFAIAGASWLLIEQPALARGSRRGVEHTRQGGVLGGRVNAPG